MTEASSILRFSEYTQPVINQIYKLIKEYGHVQLAELKTNAKQE